MYIPLSKEPMINLQYQVYANKMKTKVFNLQRKNEVIESENSLLLEKLLNIKSGKSVSGVRGKGMAQLKSQSINLARLNENSSQ